MTRALRISGFRNIGAGCAVRASFRLAGTYVLETGKIPQKSIIFVAGETGPAVAVHKYGPGHHGWPSAIKVSTVEPVPAGS